MPAHDIKICCPLLLLIKTPLYDQKRSRCTGVAAVIADAVNVVVADAADLAAATFEMRLPPLQQSRHF